MSHGQAVKGYAGSFMKCVVASPDTCSEKEVKFIELMKKKSKEDWEKQAMGIGGMPGRAQEF